MQIESRRANFDLNMMMVDSERGLVGTLALVLVVLAAMNFNSLPLVGNRGVISVEFAEAGGLKEGDSVLISGAMSTADSAARSAKKVG